MLTLGLLGCSQTNRESQSKTLDSTVTNDKVTDEYELASIYRDLESDSLLVSKTDEKKFTELLTKGRKIKEQEYGGGDCEGKFKQLTGENDTLTIDKFDCGDYGFGNSQFIVHNDSLRYVREYKMEWSPDDKGNEFNVSETTYEFSTKGVLKRARTKFINGLSKFRINEIDFEESRLPGQVEYNEFKKKLKGLALKEKLSE